MLNFDSDTRTPEATDRILLGVCAGIWGVWLIVSAVAAVALINLGRGHQSAEGSPWLLYTVIAISAIVVIGAIPLLLKARRAAGETREPAPAATTESSVTQSSPSLPVTEAPTEKMRVFGASVDPRAVDPRAVDPRAVDPRAGRHARPEGKATGEGAGEGAGERVGEGAAEHAGVLDRLWLRGTTSLLSAMGLALIGASTATYLLASGTDIGGWVALGVAALFTAAMPAVLVALQRQLDEPAGPAGEAAAD